MYNKDNVNNPNYHKYEETFIPSTNLKNITIENIITGELYIEDQVTQDNSKGKE